MKRYFIRYLFILYVIFMISDNAYSQRRRMVNYTEIGALMHHTNSLNDGSKFNAFRTRTGVSRIIKDHFALGIALGTDNYRKVNGGIYNTFSINLNTAYYLNEDLNGLRGDIYGGYAVKLFRDLNKGLTAGAGVSYSFPLKAFNLGIQTGYNYQEINFPSSFVTERNFNIGSIRLGLGVTFK